MRDFIKFCGGAFVFIGIVGCMLTALAAFAIGGVAEGLIIIASGVACSSGMILVGGVAYMLCSIDERLESQLLQGGKHV